MVKPAFLFDGRNILDHSALRKLGFEVYGIGTRGGSEEAIVAAGAASM
jgi:methylmalonyl-CoA mutase cobalamin-binding subunit